jgi:hypothetical protein
MSGREMMEYLRSASVVPSSRDTLFEKAIKLPEGDFAKVFDGNARSLQGFSITAPRAQDVVQSGVQATVNSKKR